MGFLHKIASPEWRSVSFRWRLFELLLAFGGGSLYAAALPPLNAWPLVFLAPAILLLLCWRAGTARAALLGWVWGIGWSIFAFQWLREIHPAIPWGMAPVISLWPAAWGAAIPVLKVSFLFPLPVRLEGCDAMRSFRAPLFRQLAFAAVLAAWWCVLEYVRAPLFPWNFIAVSLWRIPYLLAPLAYAGSWFIGFGIVFSGVSLALALLYRSWRLPAVAAAFWIVCAITPFQAAHTDTVNIRIGAVQGDLSQRRNPRPGEELEALRKYLDGSRTLAARQDPPELIVWPETAVPVLYRAAGEFGTYFRGSLTGLCRKNSIPMLIGVIDFERQMPGSPHEPGITNSAIFLDKTGAFQGRYDKVNRVPFGEFIPLRRFLPGALTRRIDLGRDLVPGTEYTIFEVKPSVRAGVAICYESVFATHARARARNGANLLLAISNDAWYPTSCEPEQHLANATLRSLETNLPQFRCGNNGGTLLLSPRGVIEKVLTLPGTERPELRRGEGTEIFSIDVPRNPSMTFYVRVGEWWIALLAILCAGAILYSFRQYIARKKFLQKIMTPEVSE